MNSSVNPRVLVVCGALLCASASAEELAPQWTLPKASDAFAGIAQYFQQYDVVLRPDEDAPEWWAGAPSVVVADDGTVWMACRMRTAESERGLRGYEIRILRSPDGILFEKAHAIGREDIPIPGFERPMLMRDPQSGKFKLYGCGPWQGGPWGMFKLDDVESPEQFDPNTAKLVLGPLEKTYDRDVLPVEYKDPVIVFAEGAYHCFVTGYMRKNERIYHFSSVDGENWAPVGSPYRSVMDLSDWHDFFVRPASVLPMNKGYLFVYEGSRTDWYDPVYNIATGIAYTRDLHTVRDLTPDAPLLISSTPSEHFATFRYSAWLFHGDELRVYAEVACPDGTNEVRVYRVPRAEWDAFVANLLAP